MAKDTASTILSVSILGTPEHPRYAISDQHQRYWTGVTWDSDEEAALKYHQFNEAAADIHKLLLLDHMDKPVRRIFAPVYVELYADKNIPLAAIKEWLQRTTRLVMSSDKNGNGPVDDSLGLVHIQWNEAREITLEK